MENFKKLPVIALRSMTILPDTMIHFDLIRKKSILAAEQAMSEDQEVFLVTQCHAETEDPQAEDLYQIGCIAKVKQVTKLPDNLVRVLVEGVCRGRLRTLFGEWEWLGGDIEVLEVPAMDEEQERSDAAQRARSFHRILQILSQNGTDASAPYGGNSRSW